MNEITAIDSVQELGERLLSTVDQREITEIINLFNLNLKKKEAIRASAYSDLQDKVTQEITDRLQERSGEFSNKELLDYLTAFDNIVNKNKVDKIDVPQVAIQNNINIQGDEPLTIESRKKISQYIQSVLSQTEGVSIEND